MPILDIVLHSIITVATAALGPIDWDKAANHSHSHIGAIDEVSCPRTQHQYVYLYRCLVWNFNQHSQYLLTKIIPTKFPANFPSIRSLTHSAHFLLKRVVSELATFENNFNICVVTWKRACVYINHARREMSEVALNVVLRRSKTLEKLRWFCSHPSLSLRGSL